MSDHTIEETANEQVKLDPRRIEIMAREFWRARGCPEGSPEQDWYMAEEQLRRQHGVHLAYAA